MRSFLVCLFICFAAILSLSAQQEDNVYVVNRAWKNYFSVDNHDLVYEEGENDYWIQLGDLLRIDAVEIITIAGGSYQELVQVTNLENNRSQAFYSRIYATADRQRVVDVISATSGTKSTVKLEDGTQYDLSHHDKPYFPKMEVGDEMKFFVNRNYDCFDTHRGERSFHRSLYFFADVYRDNVRINKWAARASGPIRDPQVEPLAKGNTFNVSFRDNKVRFDRFWPEATFSVQHADKRENSSVRYIGHGENSFYRDHQGNLINGRHLYFQYEDGSVIHVSPDLVHPIRMPRV